MDLAGDYDYSDSLSAPKQDDQKRAVAGPFPRITEVFNGEHPGLTEHAGNMLKFTGQGAALILPSLSVSPLLRKMCQKSLDKVTLIVGINSDSYNNGLGVMLKSTSDSDVGHDEGTDQEEGSGGADAYYYGGRPEGDGRSNYIKFHPGMDGGELRIEGPGGFGNTDIGFTPETFSASGQRLHILEITLSTNGENELQFISATDSTAMFQATWKNTLFDGTHTPELLSWTDMTNKALMIGQISLRADTAESQRLLAEYVMRTGKAIAGLVRLLMEDVIQGACQTIYLIKMWKNLSLFSKAFTLLSIGAGVTLSLLGPLAEFRAARALTQKAGAAESFDSGSLEEPRVPLLRAETDKPKVTYQALPTGEGQGETTTIDVSFEVDEPGDLRFVNERIDAALSQQGLARRDLDMRKKPHLVIVDTNGAELDEDDFAERMQRASSRRFTRGSSLYTDDSMESASDQSDDGASEYPNNFVRIDSDGDQFDEDAFNAPNRVSFPVTFRFGFFLSERKKQELGRKGGGKTRNTTTLYNMTIVDLISERGRGRKHINARRAHFALVVSSVLFWISMAALPIAMGEKVTCEGDPPALGIFVFFASAWVDLIIQMWVAMQTRRGFLILATQHFKVLTGVGLSLLGRFDTFGDVMNVMRLSHCEAITWYSIKGNVFHIPFGLELSHIAIGTLILGVFLFQALPGMILLFRKRYIAIAFKLNELNLLLTVMAEENDELHGVSLEQDPVPVFACE